MPSSNYLWTSHSIISDFSKIPCPDSEMFFVSIGLLLLASNFALHPHWLLTWVSELFEDVHCIHFRWISRQLEPLWRYRNRFHIHYWPRPQYRILPHNLSTLRNNMLCETESWIQIYDLYCIVYTFYFRAKYHISSLVTLKASDIFKNLHWRDIW